MQQSVKRLEEKREEAIKANEKRKREIGDVTGRVGDPCALCEYRFDMLIGIHVGFSMRVLVGGYLSRKCSMHVLVGGYLSRKAMADLRRPGHLLQRPARRAYRLLWIARRT